MRLTLAAILLFFMSFSQVAAQNGGYTLDEDLLYRINFGSTEDVRLLLERGANPNARTKQGESALEVALERNDKESEGMALALLEKGVDITAQDRTGNPPIITAIRYRQSRVVKELLRRGVDFHTKSKDGISLAEYAKLDGDPETSKILQELIDRENAEIARMHDPNRFKDIVEIYAMDNCVYQYWNFFLNSRQAPDKDEDTKKKIESSKVAIMQLITQIQQNYAAASTRALQNISSKVVKDIYDVLNAMISNRNRIENGVGTDDDAKRRCEKVINGLHIDFVPGAVVNKPVEAAPNKSSPPLPMDPNKISRP